MLPGKARSAGDLLLLDPGGAARRAVPREAPGIVPAPDRQPDGENGNRAGPEREIECTHAEAPRVHDDERGDGRDAGRPHPTHVREEPRALVRGRSEPEAKLRQAEYHAQRCEEDVEDHRPVDAERRERDPARGEEKRRNKVDRASRRPGASLRPERAHAELSARAREDADVREEDARAPPQWAAAGHELDA